jgi:hypothetical protein
MNRLLERLHVALVCAITPRCKEMTRLVSAEREQSLPWLTRVRMRWHYGICVWCLRYRDQLGLIGRMARSLDDGECGGSRLSEEKKAKLKEALARQEHD